MRLVDPLSKTTFSVAFLSRFRWIAAPLSRSRISRARNAARQGSWAKASSLYIEALRLRPGNGHAWVQLGHALGNMQQIDAMQIAYINATHIAPYFPLAHKHLGLVRYRTSLHEKALDSLASALFLDPQDREVRELLAGEEEESKLEQRITNSALSLADRQNASPFIGGRATILRAKARAAARRRQWGQAENLYGRLARMRPRDAHVLVQLGHALNEQNKIGDAENAFRRATIANPLLPDAWLHLGYVLIAQNKHVMAREAFSIVNRLAPTRRETHPILDTAIVRPEIVAQPFPDTGRKIVRPDGLTHREADIWLRLAIQIGHEF